MDLQPAFSPNDLVAHIAGNVANALCAREGEIQQQQDERREAAASTIMAFQPSDAVEAMLASHCVVFHEMIVAGAQETWRYEDPAMLRAKRTTIVAMDKAFGNNLDPSRPAPRPSPGTCAGRPTGGRTLRDGDRRSGISGTSRPRPMSRGHRWATNLQASRRSPRKPEPSCATRPRRHRPSPARARTRRVFPTAPRPRGSPTPRQSGGQPRHGRRQRPTVPLTRRTRRWSLAPPTPLPAIVRRGVTPARNEPATTASAKAADSPASPDRASRFVPDTSRIAA